MEDIFCTWEHVLLDKRRAKKYVRIFVQNITKVKEIAQFEPALGCIFLEEKKTVLENINLFDYHRNAPNLSKVLSQSSIRV